MKREGRRPGKGGRTNPGTRISSLRRDIKLPDLIWETTNGCPGCGQENTETSRHVHLLQHAKDDKHLTIIDWVRKDIIQKDGLGALESLKLHSRINDWLDRRYQARGKQFDNRKARNKTPTGDKPCPFCRSYNCSDWSECGREQARDRRSQP